MKIAVYTIAKNEERFAERWADSCVEADYRVVADTGSTDGTVDRLRALNVAVHRIGINPWRFDHARNAALALVPADADLCITLDMDEVLQPGWRQAVESAWVPGATRLKYQYVWNFLEDGTPGIQFEADRAHARNGYQWRFPVHETLQASGAETYVASAMEIHHHADQAKPRAQYLPLLELSVAENPESDRCAHYLGRELMFYGRHAEAITELKRHLTLPSAVWAPERSASMRHIATCEIALGNLLEAKWWLLRAAAEAPDYREPWVLLADVCMKQRDWMGGVWATQLALNITDRPMSYLSEVFAWDASVYDTGSICAYYAGQHELAKAWLSKAMEMAPTDERLMLNAEFIFSTQQAA